MQKVQKGQKGLASRQVPMPFWMAAAVCRLPLSRSMLDGVTVQPLRFQITRPGTVCRGCCLSVVWWVLLSFRHS